MNKVWVFDRGDLQHVSHNFQAKEFDCNEEQPSNHFTLIHPNLIFELQWLRDLIGLPIEILSGFRTQQHNMAVGGAERSWHTRGYAADIWVPKMGWVHTKTYIDQLKRIGSQVGGIGYYEAHKFFHVDVRPRVNGEITTWEG